MGHSTNSSRLRAHLGFLIGVFLTFMCLATPWARSAVHPARTAGPHAKSAARHTPPMPAHPARVAHDVQPPANLQRDLLTRLEEGQKGLQSQLQVIAGATQQRANRLEHRLDSVSDDLQRLTSAEQESVATQRLALATFRSTHTLLLIIAGLLLAVCGALTFFAFQLRRLGGLQGRPNARDEDRTRTAPERAAEPQWKVGS